MEWSDDTDISLSAVLCAGFIAVEGFGKWEKICNPSPRMPSSTTSRIMAPCTPSFVKVIIQHILSIISV